MANVKVLVAKPGLDGHDRGAKVVARALRDAGFEVIYTGIRLTPEQIAEAALQDDVNVVALSLLSGAHNTLFPEVVKALEAKGMGDVLVIGGGVIPAADIPGLEKAGVKTVHEISRCKDYEEYLTMAEANFNLVLHPEARFAAEDFHEKLQIPFIELRRLYQIDKITKQYQALGKVLGIPFEDHEAEFAALDSVKCLKSATPDAVFAIGECMNGDPFELALALVKYGFRVAEIY